MRAAYVNAALRRVKKLPDPSTLMITQEAKPQPTSWQAMYAVAASWAATEGEIRTERTAE
jgi:hypothetical protein